MTRSAAGDVLDVNAADGERVGNEGSVTTPRNGFGAHDGHLLLDSQSDEFFQSRCKFGCLHVIGEPAKAAVAPAGVDRVFMWMSQPAQGLHVPVGNPSAAEPDGQRVAVELRVVTGTRNRADVDQLLDVVGFQNVDEFVERVS